MIIIFPYTERMNSRELKYHTNGDLLVVVNPMFAVVVKAMIDRHFKI